MFDHGPHSFPVEGGEQCHGGQQRNARCELPTYRPWLNCLVLCSMEIDHSYLTNETTRKEVENRIDFANAPEDFRQDWERLLDKMLPGDRLWNFEPPPAAMRGVSELYRFWGVALMRNGRVVSTLIEAVD